MAVVEEIADTLGTGAGEGWKEKEARSWKSRLGNRERPVDRRQMEVRRPLAVERSLQTQQEHDVSISGRWMVLKHLLPMGLAELLLGGMSLLGFGCWERKKAPLEAGVEKDGFDI